MLITILIFFSFIALLTYVFSLFIKNLDTVVSTSIALTLSIVIIILSKTLNPFGVKGSPLISSITFIILAIILILLNNLYIDHILPWILLFVMTIILTTYTCYDIQKKAKLCLKLE